MRILFVLQADIASSSGYHVEGFAVALAAAGHDVAIAVPEGSTVPSAAPTGTVVVTARELTGGWSFPSGEAPDVVHAWTPRAVVADAVDVLRGRWPAVPVVVHLEDDERHLTASFVGRPWAELEADPGFEPDPALRTMACSPRRASALLESAQAVTCIVDALADLVPDGVPATTVWPGVDTERFHPGRASEELRRRHHVPRNAVVLAYPGAVHAANAADVRSLYVAVGLLNRRGVPAVLLRSGGDAVPFLGPDDSWAAPFVRRLGWIDRDEVPVLLATADVLVQPGRPGPGNDRRLPSKLPECLATGRATIVPRTNLGLVLEHDRHAYVLDVADGTAIADAVQVLWADPSRRAAIGAGGRRFAQERLRWDVQASLLEGVYHEAIARSPRR